MRFRETPRSATWQHLDARKGFEAAFLSEIEGGYRIEGSTSALEDGMAWVVRYSITLDPAWRTTRLVASNLTASGSREVTLEADGRGHWTVNGAPAPHLTGCLDADLESSALTNALPVHRLGLPVGGGADAPAAWIRAVDLRVERLEQHYIRVADDGAFQRYDYTAPAFGFRAKLVFDESGFVLDYPGIALRIS